MATVDSLLEKVKAIAPTLRRHTAEAETARRLSRPVVDAMQQAGLYHMARPQAFGGLELDPVSMFRVVEEAARHDSAPGWTLNLSLAVDRAWPGCPMRARRTSWRGIRRSSLAPRSHPRVVRRSRWQAATG
jgi:alkylation response protein AidB-like acyl-CoA dehydrogenase